MFGFLSLLYALFNFIYDLLFPFYIHSAKMHITKVKDEFDRFVYITLTGSLIFGFLSLLHVFPFYIHL